MREQHKFGVRSGVTSLKKEPKVKYFIISEGAKTEPIYFEELAKNLPLLKISPIVQLILLERTAGEDGWSNPKKILDRLLLKLDEDEETISFSTFIDAFLDCLTEYDIFKTWEGLLDKVKEILFKFVEEDLKKSVEDFVKISTLNSLIIKAVKYIEKEKGCLGTLVIDKFEETMRKQLISYDKEIDKICLVIDRDSKSFKSSQYDYVVKKCSDANIKLFVSNPCFEFWLLLHFDDVFDINKDELLKNKSIPQSDGKNKSFAELELDLRMPSYKKNTFDVQFFFINIDKAVQNEKSFCENVVDLKNELGSNIGLLIEELRNHNN